MSTEKQSQVKSKGLGLGGTMRHRKVLRDNIQGISKPALQRILRRAGVKRNSGLVFEEMRGILKVFMETIIHDVLIFTTHDHRVTVQISDLRAALKLRGIKLAAGINENAKRTASLQSSNSRGKKVVKAHSNPAAKKSAKKMTKPSVAKAKKATSGTATKKPHRFKPGTVALREIRRQQKNSDCLAIPKMNFCRLVREIAQDYKEDLRFSAGVCDLLQLTVEDYLVKLCAFANRLAIHAGRETLYPADLQIVRYVREETTY